MKKHAKRTTIEMPSVDRDWQKRNDLDTLRRAGEIMRDKPRMAAAKREAGEQMRELQKVVGSARGPGLGFAKD